ncbi:hypothetical protein [Aliarcobacter butzleri]|uniref:hypothetical protein n=1 Tax=Aliarcobacter butzleri TaxID=28197 RepID=UPI00189ED036|nr:hypothetical protein [Aliarcobacter butzleri]MBF7071389.1 hypothetical protein [Aliarcobacter butzleri]
MESALWGFLGTIVGVGSSISTTYLTNKKSIDLQKDADLLKRNELLRAFQRETLLNLQDTLYETIRLIAQMHFENIHNYKKTGIWGKSKFNEDIDENFMLSMRKISVLKERISNNQLRLNLDDLHQNLNKLFFAKSEKESFIWFQNILDKFESFMKELGVILRENY